MHISQSPFGQLEDGRTVFVYTLTNDLGIQVKVSDFGGIITELHVPDREGNFADVVLGYDQLAGYVQDKNYIGALIGRYANRVADASFELDGARHVLNRNDGSHHLHGGIVGFHKVLWSARMDQQADHIALILSYRSVDGEQGYPGNLESGCDGNLPVKSAE
jgi:aldose 1-epimerase